MDVNEEYRFFLGFLRKNTMKLGLNFQNLQALEITVDTETTEQIFSSFNFNNVTEVCFIA